MAVQDHLKKLYVQSSFVVPGAGHTSTSDVTSQVVNLAEQFNKFLATQSHAMVASSSNGLSSSSLSSVSSSNWVLGSGASHHMSYDPRSFASLNLVLFISVTTVDGTPMPLASTGSVSTSNLSLSNVYFIHLAFIGKLCDSGYLVFFSSTNCYVQDPQPEKVIGTGHRQGGLYMLDELLKVLDVVASIFDMSYFHFEFSVIQFLFMAFASQTCFFLQTKILGFYWSFRKVVNQLYF